MLKKIAEYDGRLHRNQDVVSRQLGEETVLIPINQTGTDLQKVYLLNETAAAIWRNIEKPCTINDLVDVLVSEYDAKPSEIRQDLSMHLEELLENSFLRLE